MVKNNNITNFFAKVYLWMFLGLAISGGIAYATTINETLRVFALSNYIYILISELIVVIAFSALAKKTTPLAAKIMFVLYSALNGLSLCSIFLVYKIGSISFVFMSSALLFGVLALYGFMTKQDLTSFGKILLAGLFTIIVMSIVNLFFGNAGFGILISVVSVVLFSGLIMWDMNRLKHIYYDFENNEVELDKISIYGALDLYLDFINIFIQLLNIFGKRKD